MKDFLNNIHKIDNDILKAYLDQWTTYDVPRKTIITEAGNTERYIYYVVEGVQKSYYLNDGKEYITFFAYAPSFSGVLESFFTQTPSKYFLETITASKFLRLPYEKHQQWMQEHREIETLFRKATELFLVGILERYNQLMVYDIQTRFKLFVERSPHLLQLVSQKDLASYLRIDATNFSKLMNSVRI